MTKNFPGSADEYMCLRQKISVLKTIRPRKKSHYIKSTCFGTTDTIGDSLY